MRKRVSIENLHNTAIGSDCGGAAEKIQGAADLQGEDCARKWHVARAYIRKYAWHCLTTFNLFGKSKFDKEETIWRLWLLGKEYRLDHSNRIVGPRRNTSVTSSLASSSFRDVSEVWSARIGGREIWGRTKEELLRCCPRNCRMTLTRHVVKHVNDQTAN